MGLLVSFFEDDYESNEVNDSNKETNENNTTDELMDFINKFKTTEELSDFIRQKREEVEKHDKIDKIDKVNKEEKLLEIMPESDKVHKVPNIRQNKQTMLIKKLEQKTIELQEQQKPCVISSIYQPIYQEASTQTYPQTYLRYSNLTTSNKPPIYPKLHVRQKSLYRPPTYPTNICYINP